MLTWCKALWQSPPCQIQLDKAARACINNPRGLNINNGKVTVSKIHSWFAHDFGNSEGA